jgi:hypothetical protein
MGAGGCAGGAIGACVMSEPDETELAAFVRRPTAAGRSRGRPACCYIIHRQGMPVPVPIPTMVVMTRTEQKPSSHGREGMGGTGRACARRYDFGEAV